MAQLSSRRADRLAEAIKKEVAHMLQDEIKDPRIGFASVTQVTVSSDLRYAKIFVSVLGDEEAKRDTQAGLENAAGYIRRELGRRIALRYVPEISFKIDSSIEHGVHISKLLSEVKKEDN